MKSFNSFIAEAYNTHINKSTKSDVKKLLAHLATYKDIDVEFPLAVNPDNQKLKIKTVYQKNHGNTIRDYIKSAKISKMMDSKVFGNGSNIGPKSGLKPKFGIKNDTAFIEFFQALGFFIDRVSEKTFVSDVLKAANNIKGDFTTKSLVTNGTFEDFVNALDSDVMKADAMKFLNGSYLFAKENSILHPAYVIWDNVEDYYNTLREFEGIKLTKENTSDIVIIKNSTWSSLKTKLQDKENIVTIGKNGKLTIDKVDFFQISLKAEGGGARLGRLTGVLKNMYYGHLNLSNYELAFIKNENIIDLPDNLLTEGFFGDVFNNVKVTTQKIISTVKEHWKKFMASINKLNGKINSEIKSNTGPEETKTISEIDQILTSNNLTERTLNVDDKIELLFSTPKASAEFVQLIDDKLKKIIPLESDIVPFNIQSQNITPKFENFRHLFGNSISFGILYNMLNSTQGELSEVSVLIDELNNDMLMGSTDLPIVKLYGTTSKSANYKILTTNTAISSTNSDLITQPPMLLDIHGSSTHYVINLYMVEEYNIKEPDLTGYHMIQFNNSGSGFSYKIEGASTKPYSKIKSKFNTN